MAAPEDAAAANPSRFSDGDVRDWHLFLDSFERQVVPHGIERGYSRDALLLGFFLSDLCNALRSVEGAAWSIASDQGDDDGGWQPEPSADEQP